MANICQVDWERVRSTEYFPETFREGACDACGDSLTFVARVSKAEAAQAKAEHEEDQRRYEAEERAAERRNEEALYARESLRLRDYDDGIIHDDDH